MPTSNSAQSTFEPTRNKFMVQTPLEPRCLVASITAQLMEIARVQTRDGVAGDARREELAGKSYIEALRGDSENATRLRSMGL